MDENKKPEEVASEATNNEATPKLSFDELLKDPDYQREFDKKVAKSTEKARAKWQKEADEKRSEAENLARMSEEEKFKYEIDKLTKERNDIESKLNAYELKNEAQKIAREKGMDISLLDIIDFRKENAESVKEKIEIISKSVASAMEKQLNERLKQAEPKSVSQASNAKKEVNRASF